MHSYISKRQNRKTKKKAIRIKIQTDPTDELDILTTTICGLVRSMIYSAYLEQDYTKARKNGLELLSILRDELNSYPVEIMKQPKLES